jgi:hypothetical protein
MNGRLWPSGLTNVRLVRGLHALRLKHRLSIDFDDYRRCGNHSVSRKASSGRTPSATAVGRVEQVMLGHELFVDARLAEPATA